MGPKQNQSMNDIVGILIILKGNLHKADTLIVPLIKRRHNTYQ
jgi:hypothetical protein